MSVYTKSNRKSWAEKGKVKFLPHAQRLTLIYQCCN